MANTKIIIDFEYFEFDGTLVEELYELLDRKLAVLKSQVDPDHRGDFEGSDVMEHICGMAAVAAQRYVAITCKCFDLEKESALKLGPKVGCTTRISAIYAAANFWKHEEDPVSKLRKGTRHTLIDLGIDLNSVVSDETSYLVSNVFHRCGYTSLQEIILDLKNWTKLVIEQTNFKV
jgi:hypothetical protein